MRNSLGQYNPVLPDSPANSQLAGELAVHHFLQQVTKHAPEVARELHRGFLTLREAGLDFGYGEQQCRGIEKFVGARLEDLRNSRHSVLPAREVAESWARRFNLVKLVSVVEVDCTRRDELHPAEWALRTAWSSFAGWQDAVWPEDELYPPGLGMALPNVPDTEIAIPQMRWHPFFDAKTREEAERDFLETAQTLIRTRLAELEQIAIAAGYVRAPDNLREEHYVWAVRYQVLGKDFPNVETSAVDVSTVRRAVSNVLQRVGLTPRTARGRPKKTGKRRMI